MGGRLGPERVELHQLGRTLSNDDHDDHNQYVGDFYRTRVRSLILLVTHSLTDSLTDCRLVNLIDVSLACEDGNSKLVEVVDDEKQFTP